MATRTVVCPECAEPLPYGRLACPSCGALLASVAGTARRVEPGPTDGIGDEQPRLPDEPPLLVPDEDDEPATLAAERQPEPSTTTLEAPPTWPEPGPIPSVLREWPLPSVPQADEVAADARVEDPPVAQAATADAAPFAQEEPYLPAGAYLPPSAVFLPDASVAPASPSADREARSRRPGDAPLLADLPLDAPDDLPGWLVVGGAVAGTIGFFLPWAHRVIGASGEGYFSSWGFGALMNVPIFIALFVTLALAVMPSRVPVWLRTGVLPLAAGGLLIGTVWPYVLYGPLNGRLGSVIEAFAGLLLVAGGLLAVRAARHAGTPPSV